MRLLLLLIISLNLFSAKINRNLFDSNNTIKTYNILLLSLRDQNNSLEYIKLQKSLIYKLINIKKFYKKEKLQKTTLESINSQKDFVKLINNIIFLKNKIYVKSLELNSIEKNLRLINSDIITIKNDNPNLLTYQLQYAFYKISQKKIKDEINSIKLILENELNIFYIKFDQTIFDKNRSLKNIEILKQKQEKLNHTIQDTKIENDRQFILKGEKNPKITKRLNKLIEDKNDLIKKIIVEYFVVEFFYLKREDTKAIEYQKIIENYANKLTYKKELAKKGFKEIIEPLIQKKLGATKVMAAKTKESIWEIGKISWDMLNKELFSINKKPISTVNLFLALFIFIIGITIARFYKINIRKGKVLFQYVAPSTQTIISNIGYYIIVIVSFFIVLNTLGLDLSSFTLIAGALSVGIGFGLQNIISNLVSGIILMFERSIKLGDYIEINEELKGRVSEIKMRSTTIITNDNIEIIVPNQAFIENNVINWTLTSTIRRFRIPFSVAYGTEISKVQEVILRALRSSNIEYIRSNLPHRKALVVMVGMNDSSVDFELFVWLEGDKILAPKRTKSEFLIMIYNALYENEIEIPFPQMDIHIKK